MILFVDPNVDPDLLRFRVLVDGWMESWTLDQIKQAIADGADVSEWPKEEA